MSQSRHTKADTLQAHRGWWARSLTASMLLLIMVGLTAFPNDPAKAKTKSAKEQEYEIKTAFIYNFLKFIDWPEDNPNHKQNKSASNATASSQSQEIFLIGFIGSYPFEIANQTIKGKVIGSKKIDTLLVAEKELNDPKVLIQELEKCQVVFISVEAKVDLQKILALIEEHPILTIGENRGFLEAGGILNFILDDNKISFEINLIAAEKAQLNIRSKLLRLAKRIIQNKQSADGEK